MLAFFVKWAPYGGPPPAEVFPEFGISAACLLTRIEEIAFTSQGADVPDADAVLLHRVRRVLRTQMSLFDARTSNVGARGVRSTPVVGER